MTSQSHLGVELRPSERLLRSGRVRLHTAAPPRRWEGRLVLTTERLFFLPDVEHPLLERVSIPVRDVTQSRRAGRNALRVSSAHGAAVFQLLGSRAGLVGLSGRRDAAWIAAILAARASHFALRANQAERAAG